MPFTYGSLILFDVGFISPTLTCFLNERLVIKSLLQDGLNRVLLSAFTCLILPLISVHSHLDPPVANGYTSARASPGLLTVSNGNNGLGKVVPAKSPPPPPSPQMANSRKPDLRVITSQGGKSLMQMVSLCCQHPRMELWKNLTSHCMTVLTTIRNIYQH